MSPDSILILCLDSYGDLTLRQPLFRSLLDAGHRVGLAVRKPHERLLPFLDARLEAIVTYLNPYEPPRGAFWSHAAALQAEIANWSPDLLVSALYNRTLLDQWLLRGCRVPSIGFASDRSSDAGLDSQLGLPPQPEPALTRSISVAETALETEKNRALLEAITGRVDPDYRPQLQLSADSEARALRSLERLGIEPGRYAFAAPAGAVNNALKSWPKDVFLRMAEHLQRRHGLRTLVTGVAVEAPFLEDLVATGAERGLRIAEWLGGPDDLGELMGLIRLSRVYLGSDTGPMHFAAALDVPVLALFGGGHWPRFLPSATRSFVATRELPCFGCGWECWLPEPACVTTIDPKVLLENADWLLSDTTPEQRLDLGRPLPNETESLIRDGAARYRRAWRQSVVAESWCRTLEARLEASELLQTKNALVIGQQQVLLREKDANIVALNAQAERLSKGPAALRVLSAVALRRLGLFEVARQGRERMKGRAPGRVAGSVEPSPLLAPTAALAQHVSLLEAFVIARALPGDAPELALERLYQLGATLRSVLCIHPSDRNAQAALMLASGGAQVAWLGEEHALHGAVARGLSTPAADLGSWLIASEGCVPRDTALLLDADGDGEVLRLLGYRLAPGALVLISGDLARATWAQDFGAPDRRSIEGLSVFETPPAAWQDPTHGAPQPRDRAPWLTLPHGLVLPKRLPSGRPWPRITVVTVSLNQARYLEETLLSVLRQEYPDLEYIVVDGGSTDDSPKILERYRKQLAHCIVEPDDGQSDALNKGFALASGGILAWLNSDDRYAAGALWRAAVAFDAYGVDVVVGGCQLARDSHASKPEVHHSSLPVGRAVPLPLEKLLDLDGSWLKGDFFYQPEVFWTRDIWQRTGARVARDLFYSMDYELWARMAHAGARAVHVPDTLAVYRMHDGQKTAGSELPYLPELRRVALELRRQWSLP